ncbi:MAG TPA: hypothetical protein VN256_19545 [Pyrinomonadaceae bacterium]|nr:hypothetical protein [Pyrinomonadaceae bacterium]
MKEETNRPEAKEDSQNEEEATQSRAAAAGVQTSNDDVQAYGEPTDASGGGKAFAEPTDASGGGK